MARLESGEVLLTTSIAEISVQIVEVVLARDATLSQCDAESVAVQLGHPGSLPEREPAAGVEATSEFDLHVALPFARPQGQAGEGLLVEIESDAHGSSVAHPDHRVKTPATSITASDPLVSLAAHSRFDASLASAFLHDKHQPPDIRRHRVPALELTFPYQEEYVGDNDNYVAGHSRRLATRSR